jgi:hypothetical protein
MQFSDRCAPWKVAIGAENLVLQANASHQTVCLHIFPNLVAWQRLGNNVTEEANAHPTVELLNASFSIRSLYRNNVYDSSSRSVLLYVSINVEVTVKSDVF